MGQKRASLEQLAGIQAFIWMLISIGMEVIRRTTSYYEINAVSAYRAILFLFFVGAVAATYVSLTNIPDYYRYYYRQARKSGFGLTMIYIAFSMLSILILSGSIAMYRLEDMIYEYLYEGDFEASFGISALPLLFSAVIWSSYLHNLICSRLPSDGKSTRFGDRNEKTETPPVASAFSHRRDKVRNDQNPAVALTSLQTAIDAGTTSGAAQQFDFKAFKDQMRG
jgi:hypothetical protein